MSRFNSLVVVFAALLSFPASAQRPLTIQQLTGEWRITQNDVEGWNDPGSVLAYGRNDSTVVGGKLVIRRSEMRLVDPKRRLRYGEHRAFSSPNTILDRCADPVLRDLAGRRFNVQCANGERFGPDVKEQLFTLVSPTKMRIEWYDGLTLYLTRR